MAIAGIPAVGGHRRGRRSNRSRLRDPQRANALLNFFHIGAAFAVQIGTGLVLQHWSPDAGQYPQIAYQTAFALNVALQIVAGFWFALPWLLRILKRTLRASSNV
jgi:hypothetical protein